MIILKQTGFDEFRCIAGECPKSCCKGWQIVIDEDSLSRYKAHEGKFRARLQSGIDFAEECFKQTDMRCSMLNDKGLCDMQLTLGEDALCVTCRDYPRYTQEYLDRREYSLALSCPEYVRRLLEPEFEFAWAEDENDEADDEAEFDDFDPLLFDELCYARDKLFAFSKKRTLPLGERLERISAAARKMQDFYDLDEIFSIGDAGFEERSELSHAEMTQELAFLETLEVLEAPWMPILRKTAEFWSEHDAASPEWARLVQPDKELAFKLEKVFQSLLFRYFCGAVYDGQIYARAEIAVQSTRLIAMINAACGELSLNECIYLYSREVEHSDENILALIRRYESQL